MIDVTGSENEIEQPGAVQIRSTPYSKLGESVKNPAPTKEQLTGNYCEIKKVS